MDKSIIEGNGDPTTGRVSFSLILFKAQEFVGIMLQDAFCSFAHTTSLKVLGKLYHHFTSNGIGPDEVFQQQMILRKKVIETIESNLNHADILLGIAADVRLVIAISVIPVTSYTFYTSST